MLSIGYDKDELESITEPSILVLDCGAPLNFANLKEGETVVDLGSGAGIDAFLAWWLTCHSSLKFVAS